jgi:hypothetical protein
MTGVRWQATLVVVVTLLAAAQQAAAAPHEFVGVCEFNAVANGDRPIPRHGKVPFSYTATGRGRCAGRVDRRPVRVARATIVQAASGTTGCTFSRLRGSGTLTIAGVPIQFSVNIPFFGWLADLRGTAGGTGRLEMAPFEHDDSQGLNCGGTANFTQRYIQVLRTRGLRSN